MKDLKELNLLDRFLFAEAMEDPENMRDVLVDAFGKAEIHLGNLTMRPGHHVPADSPFIRTLRISLKKMTFISMFRPGLFLRTDHQQVLHW